MTHCGPAAQCTRTRSTRESPCSVSSPGAGLASRGRGTPGEGGASNWAPTGGPRGEADASRRCCPGAACPRWLSGPRAPSAGGAALPGAPCSRARGLRLRTVRRRRPRLERNPRPWAAAAACTALLASPPR
eukprot:7853759-Pyramimonas_sp.AAC.1